MVRVEIRPVVFCNLVVRAFGPNKARGGHDGVTRAASGRVLDGTRTVLSHPKRHAHSYRLRPLAVEDLPTITEWMEQIDDVSLFHRWMPVPSGLLSVEADWRRTLEEAEPRSSYWFVVVDEKGTCLGFCGLKDIVYSHGSGVIPLFVAQPVRRHGVGIRMLALILDLAFNQLRLERATTYCRADNVASLGLCERAGFREEGRMRRAWYAGGTFQDLVVVGLLAEEWRVRRQELLDTLDPAVRLSMGAHVSETWTWPRAPARAGGSIRKLVLEDRRSA